MMAPVIQTTILITEGKPYRYKNQLNRPTSERAFTHMSYARYIPSPPLIEFLQSNFSTFD